MIKMRNNKSNNATCCSCGNTHKNSLGMYDICIGDNILTICDLCNSKIMKKTLSAECQKNAKVKSKEDMKIIDKRKLKGE